MSTFLTVQRAREIGSLAEADAEYLAHLVDAASTAVERYCKRTFALTSHTAEYHDGGGRTAIFLDNFPLGELVSVTVIEAGGAEVEIDGDSFRMNDGTGEIRFKRDSSGAYTCFPRGFRNIKVSYTAGFAPVPEDVTEAAAQLAAFLHANASHEETVAAERLGDYSRSFAVAEDTLPAAVRQLLAPYRNVRA